MHTARNIVIILTLAAIGLSGTVQAAEKGNKNRMERDRVTQSDINREARRAERRAERRTVADVVVRDERRANRAERRAERRAAERREQRRHRVNYDRHDRYGRVDRRQDKQRARIIQGRRSGELTRSEARRLKKQQRKIGRMERRFNADGYLSGRERYRLERAQDRASRRIARLKHNDIYRGSGHRFAHSYRSGRGHYRHH